ncbi:unannotated protein [freshwater metagenome]|uniref:Unannotated protein n=1 Tax=freshwater metagenome TaxID=449393 RepID=A0A6J7DN79_9ZZZZ
MWQGSTVPHETLEPTPLDTVDGPVRTGELLPVLGVDRGLAVLAIVWQGLWLIPDPTLWPSAGFSVAENVLLVGVIASWIGIIISTFGPLSDRTRRVRFQGVNVALLYCAGMALIGSASQSSTELWRPGASLLNLTAVMASLILATSVAVPVIVVGALAEFALLASEVSGTAAPGSKASELLYPLYALTIGAAGIGARRGLLIAARRSQRARLRLEAAEGQARKLRRIQRSLRQQTRLLHETVLNTLTAVARGGVSNAGPAGDRVRIRCDESAHVLASLAAVGTSVSAIESRDWATDLGPATSALMDLGVQVHLHVHDRQAVPDDVYSAMITAAREALANAARHAHADNVVIDVDMQRDQGSRRNVWSVTVRDDGLGFEPAAAMKRFGVTHAITQAMADVNGRATIDSTGGDGTCVTLTWQDTPESRASVVLGKTATSITALSLPILISFGLFTLLSLAFTMRDYEHPAAAIAGFVIAAGLGGLLVWFGRSGVVPAWLVIGVCLAAPLVYRLQELGLGSGELTPWSDWASQGIVALLLVLAGTGPWWAWIAALVSWLLTQGDVVGELLRPGTGVIIAGALFARSVRANDRAYTAAMRKGLLEEASAAADQESIRVIARRYASLGESQALALLQGIAEGTLDPSDEAVRACSGREERFIRSVMRIDPEVDPLHAFALQLAIRAHRRECLLDIDLADSPRPRRGQLLVLQSVANRAIDHSLTEVPARLTARREGDSVMVRLVVAVSPDDIDAAIGGNSPQPAATRNSQGDAAERRSVEGHHDPVGGIVMWEALFD